MEVSLLDVPKLDVIDTIGGPPAEHPIVANVCWSGAADMQARAEVREAPGAIRYDYMINDNPAVITALFIDGQKIWGQGDGPRPPGPWPDLPDTHPWPGRTLEERQVLVQASRDRLDAKHGHLSRLVREEVG